MGRPPGSEGDGNTGPPEPPPAEAEGGEAEGGEAEGGEAGQGGPQVEPSAPVSYARGTPQEKEKPTTETKTGQLLEEVWSMSLGQRSVFTVSVLFAPLY